MTTIKTNTFFVLLSIVQDIKLKKIYKQNPSSWHCTGDIGHNNQAVKNFPGHEMSNLQTFIGCNFIYVKREMWLLINP